MSESSSPSLPLPRVAIQFCTQCKWMLRAAYFAQELLSTFSTSLGEVALIPSTGGTFVVTITTAAATSSHPSATTTTTLWDRRSDGGFPETKELKRRVRDVIDPARDLGHVDRNRSKPKEQQQQDTSMPEGQSTTEEQAPGLQRHPVRAGTFGTQTAGGPVPAEDTPIAQETAATAAVDEATRTKVEQARANKGEQDLSGADGAALKAQFGKSGTRTTADESKQTCEDCA